MSEGWHGLGRGYRRLADGREGASLRAVRPEVLRLDRRGVEQAWGLAAIEDGPDRTVLDGVRRLGRDVAGVAAVVSASEAMGAWAEHFQAEVDRIAASAEAPALALGGGLDAAAVLGAWRRSGAPLPTVLTLETGLADYDEVTEARAIATAFGARCEGVRVTAAALVDVLPQAIAAAESPLYNLHPVSRFALARVARGRGHRTLITGDGADAAFAGRPDLDYVPIVAALTEAAGLTLASPFFAAPVLATTLAGGRDPDKQPLRAFVRDCGLPAEIMARPKRARWMPPIDVACHRSATELERLGRELGLAPRLDSDRAAVSWTTLSLLVRSLEGSA